MPSRKVRSTLRQTLLRLDTELQKELNAELLDAGKRLKSDFQNVTANWTHKPQFQVTTEIGIRYIAVRVVPKNNRAGMIWTWLDQGTGRYGKRKMPYIIRPKPPRTTLAFQTGYSPKTAVGARGISGFGGIGRATGSWVKAKQVTHPGIKPRKFSIVFSDRLKPPLNGRIENAIRRAIRRAAH